MKKIDIIYLVLSILFVITLTSFLCVLITLLNKTPTWLVVIFICAIMAILLAFMICGFIEEAEKDKK